MPKSGDFFKIKFNFCLNKLKYIFPAQQKLCSESIGSYLHVEPIPTTKNSLVAFYELLKCEYSSGAAKGPFLFVLFHVVFPIPPCKTIFFLCFFPTHVKILLERLDLCFLTNTYKYMTPIHALILKNMAECVCILDL